VAYVESVVNVDCFFQSSLAVEFLVVVVFVLSFSHLPSRSSTNFNKKDYLPLDKILLVPTKYRKENAIRLQPWLGELGC